jgi:hypothetical protein
MFKELDSLDWIGEGWTPKPGLPLPWSFLLSRASPAVEVHGSTRLWRVCIGSTRRSESGKRTKPFAS